MRPWHLQFGIRKSHITKMGNCRYVAAAKVYKSGSKGLAIGLDSRYTALLSRPSVDTFNVHGARGLHPRGSCTGRFGFVGYEEDLECLTVPVCALTIWRAWA
jgi:hypothetical protein